MAARWEDAPIIEPMSKPKYEDAPIVEASAQSKWAEAPVVQTQPVKGMDTLWTDVGQTPQYSDAPIPDQGVVRAGRPGFSLQREGSQLPQAQTLTEEILRTPSYLAERVGQAVFSPEGALATKGEERGVVGATAAGAYEGLQRPMSMAWRSEDPQVANQILENVNAYEQERATQDAGASGFLAKTWRGTLNSAPTMILGGAAGGAPGAILFASATEMNDAIQEGQKQGLQGADLNNYVLRAGLIEAAPATFMNAIGLPGLEGVIGNLRKAGVEKQLIDISGRGIMAALKQAGVSTLSEVPEEIVTEIGHNLNAGLSGVDPSRLTKEAMFDTAVNTTAQTLMTMGLFNAPGLTQGAAQSLSGEHIAAKALNRGYATGQIDENLQPVPPPQPTAPPPDLTTPDTPVGTTLSEGILPRPETLTSPQEAPQPQESAPVQEPEYLEQFKKKGYGVTRVQIQNPDGTSTDGWDLNINGKHMLYRLPTDPEGVQSPRTFIESVAVEHTQTHPEIAQVAQAALQTGNPADIEAARQLAVAAGIRGTGGAITFQQGGETSVLGIIELFNLNRETRTNFHENAHMVRRFFLNARENKQVERNKAFQNEDGTFNEERFANAAAQVAARQKAMDTGVATYGTAVEKVLYKFGQQVSDFISPIIGKDFNQLVREMNSGKLLERDIQTTPEQQKAQGAWAPEKAPTVVPVEQARPLTGQDGVEQPASAQQTAVPEPVTQEVTPEPPPTTTSLKHGAVVELPLERIKLSEDVPQFKEEADESGIVEPLQGKFSRTPVRPIVVWERNNGNLEVITGRHRLDLARRSGENTIPAQVLKESEGFTQQQAMILDAEANIQDGQGSVYDHAQYIRQAGLTREEAEARGIVRGDKAKQGFTIGKYAGDDLYTIYVNERGGGVWTDKKVATIAQVGRDNDGLQHLGINYVLKNPRASADQVGTVMQAFQNMSAGGTQTDMFGASVFEDYLAEAESRSKKALEIQRDIRERLKILKAAKIDPEKAGKLGINIDVKDPNAIQSMREQLETDLYRWQDWPQYPDLVKQVVGDTETETEQTTDDDQTPRFFSTDTYNLIEERNLLLRRASGDPKQAWFYLANAATSAAMRGEPVNRSAIEAMRRALRMPPAFSKALFGNIDRVEKQYVESQQSGPDEDQGMLFSTDPALEAERDLLVKRAGGDTDRAWKMYERMVAAAANRGEPVDPRKADAMRRALVGDQEQGDLFGETAPEKEKRTFTKPVERPVQQSLEGLDEGMLFSTATSRTPIEYVTYTAPDVDEQTTKSIVSKVIRHFRTTSDYREAGYVTPDGRMLDLSGKRMGGQPGVRAVDHREVPDLGGAERNDDMLRAIDAGLARVDFTQGLVHISRPLNPKQKAAIIRGMEQGEPDFIRVEAMDGKTHQTVYYADMEGTDTKAFSRALNEAEAVMRGERKPEKVSYEASTPDMRYSTSQTDTPEFKRWFGDSKVVDADGKPLVVYKGMLSKDWETGEEINVIDSPNGPWAGFFSSSKEVAQGFEKAFATMGEAKTLEVYLSIKNPYIVNAQGRRAKEFMFDDTVFGKNPTNPGALAAFNNGYDGIVIKNTEDEGDIYIPKSSTQIKSSDEVTYDDQGTPIPQEQRFDPTNPDIRYSTASPDLTRTEYRQNKRGVWEGTLYMDDGRPWGIARGMTREEAEDDARRASASMLSEHADRAAARYNDQVFGPERESLKREGERYKKAGMALQRESIKFNDSLPKWGANDARYQKTAEAKVKKPDDLNDPLKAAKYKYDIASVKAGMARKDFYEWLESTPTQYSSVRSWKEETRREYEDEQDKAWEEYKAELIKAGKWGPGDVKYSTAESHPQPLGLPELERMAVEMLGSHPQIKRKMRIKFGGQIRGSFSVGGIDLRADIFIGPDIHHAYSPKKPTEEQINQHKAKMAEKHGVSEDELVIQTRRDKNGYVTVTYIRDHGYAAKTFAHEIGHADDWLPDKDMERGNLLGRIAKLSNYLKGTLDPSGNPEDALSKKDRYQIRKRAQSLASQDFDYKEDPEGFNERVKYLYAQFVQDEIGDRALYHERDTGREGTVEEGGGYVTPGIRTELMNLSAWWKGDFDRSGDDSYSKYRRSSSELYADAISVLLNAPDMLAEKAPQFYDALNNFFDKHQPMAKLYKQIQEEMSQGLTPEMRLARERAMMARSSEARNKAIKNRVDQERIPRTPKEFLRSIQYDYADTTAYLPTLEAKLAAKDINYAAAQLQQYQRDMKEQVGDVMEEAGATWDDFGLYLKNRRAAGERQDMMNPGGIRGKDAKALLDTLRQDIGDEQYAAIEKAAKAMWDIRNRHIIPLLRESGLFTEELMRKIETNEEYATFSVVKYFEQHHGGDFSATIKRQIGTAEDIGNPFFATVRKDGALLFAARTNIAKRTMVDQMNKYDSKNIQDAKYKWNGVTQVPQEPDNPKVYGLVRYVEDGVQKGVVVRREIADLFKHDPQNAGVVFNGLSAATGLLKSMFTANNPLFSIWNIQRDARSTLHNIPTTGLMGEATLAPELASSYLRTIRDAYLHAFKKHSTPLMRELLEGGLLIADRQWTARDRTNVDEYERMQAEFDQKPDKLENVFQKGARAIFHDFNQMVEVWSKLAGYEYMKRKGLVDQHDMRNIMRGIIGSPDFLTRGRYTMWTNMLFLYSNAQVQGLDAAYRAVKANPVRYMMRRMAYTIIPSLIMAYLAFGDDDDDEIKDYREAFQAIPDYEKARMITFPVSWDGSKVSWIPMPQDHIGELLHGMIWNAFASDDKSLKKIFNVAVGAVPMEPGSLNPWLNLGRAAFEYAIGQNPYDLFRGRPAIDETIWRAGGFRSAEEFAKWAWNQTGGSTFGHFERPFQARPKGTASLPVIKPAMRRFIRTAEKQDAPEPVDTERARTLVSAKDFAADQIRNAETEKDANPMRAYRAWRKANQDAPRSYKYTDFKRIYGNLKEKRWPKK